MRDILISYNHKGNITRQALRVGGRSHSCRCFDDAGFISFARKWNDWQAELDSSVAMRLPAWVPLPKIVPVYVLVEWES